MSCLSSLIEAAMEDSMVVLMVETLALICFTSFRVIVKLDCKVLKQASKS
jgi:hypothetical protein